jgi:putative transposase
VMPDHFHILLTPTSETPLEKAVQYIKGGFSFRARKELNFSSEIWQRSYASHQVKDSDYYARLCGYILHNPVKRFLSASEEQFPFSSASPGAETDPTPPWLKPLTR